MRSNSSSSFEKGFVGHTNVKPTCKQASLLKREDVWAGADPGGGGPGGPGPPLTTKNEAPAPKILQN